jgi:hypothetical protein
MHRTSRLPRDVTRRVFLGATTGSVGAALLNPESARAGDDERRDNHSRSGSPNPIPATIAPFAPFAIRIHHLPPSAGQPLANMNEPSQITDFSGFVGVTRILGGGTGINTDTGETQPLAFQADMGFHQGRFVGTDGRLHEGTFAFV